MAAMTMLLLMAAIVCGQKATQTTQARAPCRWQGEHLFFQIGTPRSASTWQFEVTCRALQIATRGEHRNSQFSLGCAWGTTKAGANHGHDSYEVRKTHGQPQTPHRANDTVYLVSAPTDNYSSFALPHAPCFVQSYEKFVDEGLWTVRAYQHIFGLNETEYQELREFMEYWQIIRQCCGPQSSCTNVLELNAQNSSILGLRRDFSVDYPACRMYDLPRTERLLAATTVWQEYQRLIKEAKMQGPQKFHWSGPGFCQAANEEIKRGRGFNGFMLGRDKDALSCHAEPWQNKLPIREAHVSRGSLRSKRERTG
jgi:hypothetical protein